MSCHSFSLFHLFLTSFLTLPNVSLRVLYIFQYKCNLKYWNTETVSFLFNVIDPAHFYNLSFILFVSSVNASFTTLLSTFLLFLNLVVTLNWLFISWLFVHPVTVRQKELTLPNQTVITRKIFTWSMKAITLTVP